MHASTRSPAAPSDDARTELRAILRAVTGLATGAAWVDLGSAIDDDDAGVVGAASSTRVPRAEIADAAGCARVRATIGDPASASAVVTCLHVLQDVPDPAPLVGMLLEVAERGATVVVSLPDVAPGAWGGNPAEEVRRLLPADAVALRVVPLRGAALVPTTDAIAVGLPDRLVASATTPAVAHVLAFGPGAQRLAPGAAELETTDLGAARAERRALLAELDVLRAAHGRD